MSLDVKARILRIEELLTVTRSLVSDLRDESDLLLRPVLAAIDGVSDALSHATAPRETAGNLFKADTTGQQQTCPECGRYKACLPAGKQQCLFCQPLPPYAPREISADERAMRDREINAITQGQHQWIFGEEK